MVGVCREQSVGKLEGFKGRITVVPGATDDAGVHQESSRGMRRCAGSTRAAGRPRILDGNGAGCSRLRASGRPPRVLVGVAHQPRRPGRLLVEAQSAREVRRLGRARHSLRDLNDQVEACRRVFASDTRWTLVRGSDLEEGESQGLPVWSRHVGDPILASNRPAASTSPCSWSRLSRTTSSSTRPRRSSAAKHRRRWRTRPASELFGGLAVCRRYRFSSKARAPTPDRERLERSPGGERAAGR